MFLVQCRRNVAAGGQSTIGWFYLSCRAVFHFITRVFGLMNAVQHCVLYSRAWKNAGRANLPNWGSDAQIAFYYYLLFLWHQVTGAESELALRLFNGVWVFLAAWFFRKEPKVLVILLLSPFFIYYTEELRPYILQIAASCGGNHAALSSQQRAFAKVPCHFWVLVFSVPDKPDGGCMGFRLYGCIFHLVIPAVQRTEFLEGRILLDFSVCRASRVLCLYPFPRGPFRCDIFQLGC